MPSNIVKLLVRRGDNQTRRVTVFDEGEIAYVNNATYERLYVGTGNPGGAPIGSKLFFISDWASGGSGSPSTLSFVEHGDMVYNIQQSKLYALSGGTTNNTNSASYLHIGTGS